MSRLKPSNSELMHEMEKLLTDSPMSLWTDIL